MSLPTNCQPLVAVLGPTGSGKTSLALAIAENQEGEIVNCDSLQLYRGLNIGTAKTPPAQRRGIPHHLFDVLDPQQSYSAGEYGRHGREVLAEIAGRGRLPVVVGGTGFYLKALLDGLPELPQRDEELREELRSREQSRPGSLHWTLSRLDPDAAARIHAHDVQKLIRALEVHMLTRRPLPSHADALPLAGFDVVKIGLNPDRGALVQRLDDRTNAMFHGGLIEEVQGLLSGGATGAEKPFESLGYKQALLHLRGALRLEEAVASTQLETRQYAKRQLTWFRRDPDIYWIPDFGDSGQTQAAALAYVHARLPRNYQTNPSKP